MPWSKVSKRQYADLPDQNEYDGETKDNEDGGTERNDDPQWNGVVVDTSSTGRDADWKLVRLRRVGHSVSADQLRERRRHRCLSTTATHHTASQSAVLRRRAVLNGYAQLKNQICAVKIKDARYNNNKTTIYKAQ